MALGEWKDRIIIQKSMAGNDKAGNHVLDWQDYYTCHAYVNNLSGKEYWEAAQLNAKKRVVFLIRIAAKPPPLTQSISASCSGDRSITSHLLTT